MRNRFFCVCVVGMLWGAALASAAGTPTAYYLALGDSLAQGVQPSLTGTGDMVTNQGYVDDLFAKFSPRIPGLALEKLGCPGETSSSMITGGVCDYGGSSQLDAAVSFLKTHKVAFVTLDIGANDVDGCVSATSIDTTCVQNGLKNVAANLPWILRELREAAGPKTLIVGMNYYDPFLSAWILGANGPALALQTLEATTDFNVLLGSVYAAFAIPMADVARAFRTYNFLPVPGEDVPVNVFLTLAWTWMGAPPPIGPDFHPNSMGYAAIAGAFISKIVTP